MKTYSRKKQNRKKQSYRSLEKVLESNYLWVVPLAEKLELRAVPLSLFLSEILVKITESPISNSSHWQDFLDSYTKIWTFVSPENAATSVLLSEFIGNIEDVLNGLTYRFFKSPQTTQQKIASAITVFSRILQKKPQLIALWSFPEVFETLLGERVRPFVKLIYQIPSISMQVAESFPEIREMLFQSLFEMAAEQRADLNLFAEECMRECFLNLVIPKLEKSLSYDIKGYILLPIFKGAIESIPGQSCLNAVLNIISTPVHELTVYRIVAIGIQELGGLFVKLSQVISELCPPGLARELRKNQDDAGGLLPGVQASWELFLKTIDQDNLKEIRDYLSIPTGVIKHFASASVGTLYEIPLNDLGKQKFSVETALVKIKRPGIEELLAKQHTQLIGLCDQTIDLVELNQKISKNEKQELVGIAIALKRAITNYFIHSFNELDFTTEEVNANRVSEALGEHSEIKIPRYFVSTRDCVLLERVRGVKVTQIVKTKYLKKVDIADKIVVSYLSLLFDKGVVWADPHPGNILYDDKHNQISMIDLNPSFVWDSKTIDHFKNLLYRLMLRDTNGVYAALFDLVSRRDELQQNDTFALVQRFLENSDQSNSLTRFIGEFLKVLAENNLELKIEVQAAMRGLTQLALTCSSISVRNTFAQRIRHYFGWTYLLKTTLDVGVLRVLRTASTLLFNMMRENHDSDVGPVLDERDLLGISNQMRLLQLAGVCNLRLMRVSPDENPTLKLSSDESSLMISSSLKIVVLEATRPVTVQYQILIPTRNWLRDRQEFVKLSSIARNLSEIECLEQLRRNSLDDYWRIIEAWNKETVNLNVEQLKLIGEVKVASRKLVSLRFKNIFENPYAGVSFWSKIFWKMLIQTEYWKEETQQAYFVQVGKKLGNIPFTKLAFSTFYRVKMLVIAGQLHILRSQIKRLRYSLHLLPITIESLVEIILFGLSRQSPSRVLSTGGAHQRNLRNRD